MSELTLDELIENEKQVLSEPLAWVDLPYGTIELRQAGPGYRWRPANPRGAAAGASALGKQVWDDEALGYAADLATEQCNPPYMHRDPSQGHPGIWAAQEMAKLFSARLRLGRIPEQERSVDGVDGAELPPSEKQPKEPPGPNNPPTPPSPPVENVFCKTGQGGGVDPTCGAGGGVANSPAITGPTTVRLVHGTTPENADKIRSEGFNTGKGNKQYYGEGVYFYPAAGESGSRSKFYGAGSVTTTATLKNPYVHEKDVPLKEGKKKDLPYLAGHDGPYSAKIDHLVDSDPELSKMSATAARPKALTRILQAEGYDSVVSWEGGHQIVVVFDPKSLAPDQAPVANVFCKTGQGGGIDPTCSPKSGAGSGGAGSGGGVNAGARPTLSREELLGLTKQVHQYAAASPKDKVELLAKHGYPTEPGKFPSNELLRQHLVNRATAERAAQSGTTQGGLAPLNPKHEEARARVASLEEKLQHVAQKEQSLAQQAAAATDPKERDRLYAEKYKLGEEKDRVAQEAHQIIKDALGPGGQKVDRKTLPDPDAGGGTLLNGEAQKSRQFLDGLLHNGEVAPVPTSRVFGGRPGYDWEGKSILLPGNTPAEGISHEYGHHIEHTVPGAMQAAQAFHAKRTAGEAPVVLKEKYPQDRYKPTELGQKDDFEKAAGDEKKAYYVGKTYEHGGTEIISMGLELMHKDPVRLAKQDPEYFHFIMQVLGGENRGGGAGVQPVGNIFCPTGPGGGVDPTCGAGGKGGQGGSAGGGVHVGRVDESHPYVKSLDEQAARARIPHGITDGKGQTDAYYKSLGHSDESLKQVDHLRDRWADGGDNQKAARAEMERHLREDTPVGRLLKDQMALENRLYDRFIAGHHARKEAAEREAAKDFEDTYPDKKAYDKYNYPGAWDDDRTTKVQEASTDMAGREFVYRKGRSGDTIESWTSNPEGANFAPITKGGEGSIGTDRQKTVQELRQEGYQILGGVNRPWGQQGEGEITMVNLSKIQQQ